MTPPCSYYFLPDRPVLSVATGGANGRFSRTQNTINFSFFLLVHRLYIIFRKNKESMNQEPMKKFNICLLQIQRLLREKYSRWRFSAKSALLEECPDKMTVFLADDRSKAIIFAFYHLRFVLLKSSALLLCLLLFIKAEPLIFLAVICWPHVTNKSSNRLFFLQSRVFLHELVPFILRQSGNRLCQF